ncbi:8-amino-7-oxononanoate synthase [candidate division NPL-UPA2 bacterium]|nr:8-amino-7-oxononanoate synthase [candidate division NPL-UPA2 bacterium]
MEVSDPFEKGIRLLKEKNLFRELKLLEGEQGSRIVINGREVVNLSSNDYLGLARHGELKEAAREAVEKYGTSASSSRLIAGNMELHRKLEKRIADFKGTESSLLFSTGYMANLGTLSAIVGRGDIVFSDRLNHASIIDGILLSKAELKRYPHRNTKALRDLLKKHKDYGRRLMVTDSIFSMDGDIAPLPELVDLAREYNCLLMVDEAHATGVLGEMGRGAIEYFHLEGKVDIQMGTLSKALGGFGAFIAGSRTLCNYLINKARSFIYTTAPPPSVLATALAALELVDKESWRRKDLWENVHFFKEGLRHSGFNTLDSQTQIIPILVGDNQLTMTFSQGLFKEGVYIQGIRPPSVPSGEARLRATIMATHTRSDLEEALRALERVGKKLGII